MDFTTILQMKLAIGLIIFIVVYFTCISVETRIELFKHFTKKEQLQIHLIRPTRK